MKNVASLHYGVIFKKAFSQPDIFTAFVRDILGVAIEIDHVETEKSFDKPIGHVDSRFDLFAEDSKNRIIVDIQHRRYADHYHRFLYYHCAALLQQAVNSRDYRPALQVYTIVVLTAGDRHQRDVSLIEFDPKDRDGVPLGEIKHKIVYLCPKYVDDKTPEPWREWLLAIDDSLDEQVDESAYQNESVRKILQTIEKDALTPQDYARMKDEYSEELLRTHHWEKFQKQTVQRMLAKNMDAETVAEIMELPLDVVRSLQ